MNVKNNKRATDSKTKIKKVFSELLKDSAPQRITVQDICRLAEINRSTFYAHYTDVYALMEDISKGLLEEMKAIFLGPGSLDELTIGSLPEKFLRMFEFIRDNKAYYASYIGGTLGWLAEITEQEPFKSALRYAGEHFGHQSGEETDYHVAFFAWGLGAIINKWLENDCRETPEELNEIIAREYHVSDYL